MSSFPGHTQVVGHCPAFPEAESSPLSGGPPGLAGSLGPYTLAQRAWASAQPPAAPGSSAWAQDCSGGLEESVAREALCPGQRSRYRLLSSGHLKVRK